jgi:gluconokinase
MRDRPEPAIVAIDIGTTQIKAALFHGGQGLRDLETQSCDTSYPKPGFAEQDPEQVAAAVVAVVSRLVSRSDVSPAGVGALVFSGIWQSLVPVDGDGNALCPALTWADSRAVAQAGKLKGRLDGEEVRRRTGCGLHPMYFLPRLAWLREHAPSLFGRARRFVSLKEYVINRLFGDCRVDHSIASGTGIWNMHTMGWDRELLAELALTPDRFSECVEPVTVLGGLRSDPATRMGLRAGTPGVIGAADGALAHLGSVGLRDDRMSLTVGTGAALRMRSCSPRVIPGSEAWCYYLAGGHWLQGGILPGAGNTMHWLAETIMPGGASAQGVFEEINRLAAAVPCGCDGLTFLPFLAGERCPDDLPDAGGMLWGLRFAHTRGHLVRALMEGVACSLQAIYRMLGGDTDRDLVVTGGIRRSPVWTQILADTFGRPLWLPRVPEASAWGAILLAMRALGVFSSLEAACGLVETAERIAPGPDAGEAARELLLVHHRIHSRVYRSGLYRSFKEEKA